MLHARNSGTSGPFASDAGMEELMRAAGADQVRTVRQGLPVRFADADRWRAFSLSTGQRTMWRCVPEDVRHTLGIRPT